MNTKKETKFRDSLQHEESKIVYDVLIEKINELKDEVALLKLKIALGSQYEIVKHNFQNNK